MRVSLLLALCEIAPNEAFLMECQTILTRLDPRFIPGEEVAWSVVRLAISRTGEVVFSPEKQPSWCRLKRAYLRRFDSH